MTRARWCPLCDGAKAPSQEVCVACGVTRKATRSVAPEFDVTDTAGLWALRQKMLDGNEAVGFAILAGRAKGEALEGARMRVVLVERVDAALLSRGETVPPPWWDDEDA